MKFLRWIAAGTLVLGWGISILVQHPFRAEGQPFPPTQCVATAIAGGTGDAITIPRLSCPPTTTLLILKLTASNATTTPTITVIGLGGPFPIVNFDGVAISAGAFANNQTRIFTFDGQQWKVLTAGLNASTGMVFVADNTGLQNLKRNTATTVTRVDFATGNGAPSQVYQSKAGPCSNYNYPNTSIVVVADNGYCVNANDGNSWFAQGMTGKINILEFGAVPDDATAADAPIAAAVTYASVIGGCGYVPSAFPGFLLNSQLILNAPGSGCIVGDRGWKNFPKTSAGFGTFCDLHFTNDTNGIVTTSSSNQSGVYIADISICGNASTSTSSAQTSGLTFSNGVVDVIASNIFVSNFVICKTYGNSAARFAIDNVACFDQGGYPNYINGYPLACSVIGTSGPGASAAFQESGGECRAAAGATDAFYIADGSTSWYQVCIPGAFTPGGIKPTGSPLNCNGSPEYNSSYLFRADGIKVREGTVPPLQNGQPTGNAPIVPCDPASYIVYDISTSGGNGSGGTPLYCKVFAAVLVSGNATIGVPSVSGVPTGTNILVTAAEGIPLETTVVSTQATSTLNGITCPCITLSNPVYVTTTTPELVTITQELIATSGPPNFSQACQKVPGQGTYVASCGYALEVRFTTPPANGLQIDLNVNDPTGKAAYLVPSESDYVFLRPHLVGGYDFGLKHTGLSDGGLEFRPTYVEILNHLASVERVDPNACANPCSAGVAPFGDVIVANRVINPPIPDSPGNFDPKARNGLRVIFNGATYFDPSSSHPGYVTGNWYWPLPVMNRNLITIVNNTIQCHRALIGPGALPKALAVDVDSAGVGNVNLALYANNPITSRPGSLLGTTGNIAVSTSGPAAAAISYTRNTTLLPSGTYWVCSLWDTNGSSVNGIVSSALSDPNVDGGWAMGNPGGPGTVLTNGTPLGVSFAHSFSSGYPSTLINLTSDANNTLPLVGWQD